MHGRWFYLASVWLDFVYMEDHRDDYARLRVRGGGGVGVIVRRVVSRAVHGASGECRSCSVGTVDLARTRR